MKDFARAIADGTAAPIPGEVGVLMMRLEEAILRSASSGQWETILPNR